MYRVCGCNLLMFHATLSDTGSRLRVSYENCLCDCVSTSLSSLQHYP